MNTCAVKVQLIAFFAKFSVLPSEDMIYSSERSRVTELNYLCRVFFPHDLDSVADSILAHGQNDM